MKKNLLKRFFAAVGILLLGVAAVWANEARLIITTKGGTVAEFLIADSPVITYQDNLLEVKGGNMEISVEADEVGSFDFIPSESGVDEIYVGDSQLSGLKPGTPVEVYTFDGKLTSRFKADDSQTVKLNLSDLEPGFYIIRTPETSFKIKKN